MDFLLNSFYVLLVLTFWALVADVCFGPVGEDSILRILSVLVQEISFRIWV